MWESDTTDVSSDLKCVRLTNFLKKAMCIRTVTGRRECPGETVTTLGPRILGCWKPPWGGSHHWTADSPPGGWCGAGSQKCLRLLSASPPRWWRSGSRLHPATAVVPPSCTRVRTAPQARLHVPWSTWAFYLGVFILRKREAWWRVPTPGVRQPFPRFSFSIRLSPKEMSAFLDVMVQSLIRMVCVCVSVWVCKCLFRFQFH